jgi:spoIIIJ-associated protein
LGETGKRAYDFLSNVTKLMGVEVEIRIKENEGHMFAQMSGDALGVLIGRRGETLDALQYLTSLQVNKGRDEYTRVSLDSEHYRAKREDALRKLAARMAARARKTGHRVALEPMNPYERRVLHSALQDNPYVTTHSEGEEPYRRVIITLK